MLTRRTAFAALPLAALALALPGNGLADTPAVGTASLEVTITGIRANTGVIRLALCPPQGGFPDCKARVVRTATLPIIDRSARTVLTGLAPGPYAVSLFHDANSNNKLDTFVGIPREGYGFSRNPGFRPRAPRFDETRIEVSGRASTTISLRYIL
jgi:uncharacterized protein (DUF2141 family)